MPCLTNRCKIEDQCANYAGNNIPLPKIQSLVSLAPVDGSTVHKPEDCKNFKEIATGLNPWPRKCSKK